MANLKIFNQFKDKNSCINEAILTKSDLHHHVMTIHIKFKFHGNLFTGYLVLAQFVNFTLIQGQNAKPYYANPDYGDKYLV